LVIGHVHMAIKLSLWIHMYFKNNVHLTERILTTNSTVVGYTHQCSYLVWKGLIKSLAVVI